MSPTATVKVRIVLPAPLRAMAGISGEVALLVEAPATMGRVVDAVEAAYPALRHTLREAGGVARRPMIRFFACGEDWSNEGMDVALPGAVQEGREALIVLGAIAGG